MEDENYYHISILINSFNLRLHLSFPQIKSLAGVPCLKKIVSDKTCCSELIRFITEDFLYKHLIRKYLQQKEEAQSKVGLGLE